MGAKVGGKGAFSDINMTPLIDIVLVVLIIMMVNIPIQIEEMGLNLPNPIPPVVPPPPDPNTLIVGMYEDGTTGLNRRVMKEDELFYEMTRRLKPMTNKIVFIDAFPSIKYGLVVDMIDMAKEAGAEKVAFAKLKPEGPAQATSVSPGAMPRGVTFGSPSVVGEMTEKKAYEAYVPHHGVAQSCYAQVLAINPTAGGRLVLYADIGPQGEVMGKGVVTDTVEDANLPQCILDELPGRLFEPLGEDKTARVHYPFLFSPG